MDRDGYSVCLLKSHIHEFTEYYTTKNQLLQVFIPGNFLYVFTLGILGPKI